MRTLAEIGVDYVQGYAVSRSMAPDILIAAPSCASFIQDEQLQQLVQGLSAQASAAEALAPLDILVPRTTRLRDVH